MAGTEVSDPLKQFTKIKELEITPEKAPEEEEEKEKDAVCRVKEHPSPGEVEAECTHGALQTGIPEGGQGLVLASTEDGEKHVLALQAVHLSSEDVGFQEVGWLPPQHQEGVQAVMPQTSSGLQSLLWLGDGSQQSLHQCVAINLHDEMYSLQEMELMEFHVLEEHVAVAGEDSKSAASHDEGMGLKKVLLVFKNGPLPWGEKTKTNGK